jgi:hypothetical protein
VEKLVLVKKEGDYAIKVKALKKYDPVSARRKAEENKTFFILQP